MSEVNPTSATEDPPPLVNEKSAASEKNNNAEKFGPEEIREVAVTSNNADEVKNDCENGTEGAADEVANIVEADHSSDSACANVVGAEDVKMVDTQPEANTEGAHVKMVDTQHEPNTDTEDVKMVDTQPEANIEAEDVKMVDIQDEKMVHRQLEANIEAEEGKNGDNQHDKATEGEDIKMIEAKATARNSEAQDTMEDVCQKEDKVRKHEDSQDVKVAEADEMKTIEATSDVRNAEVQENVEKEEMEEKVEEKKNNTNIEDDDVKSVDKEAGCQIEDKGNNEDGHDAEVAEGDEIRMEETEDKVGEKENNANIEEDFDKEVACQKEDVDNHNAKVAEGDEVKMVVAKTDAGNAEVEGNETEEKAKKNEQEKNNANIVAEDFIVLDKDDACLKEDSKVKNEDIQDAKEADGDMKVVEEKTDARIADAIANRKKGEMEGNTEENKNDTRIDAENVIMVDQESACLNKHKGGKTDDSQDDKAAEGEDIKIVDAKSNAGNAGVKENGKKEEKVQQNEEIANDVNNQADGVKIIEKEDACQKEDKGRKNEDSHHAKSAEFEEIMVVEANSADVHAEVKENGKKEEDQSTTEEEQNGDKEEIICVKRQDEDRMDPMKVDKQEKQDGSNMEEKHGVDKQEVSDREEIVNESQEVLKGEAKDNLDKQEMDDREENVKEKQEGLEEEERVGSRKNEVAKDEQNGAAEKQDGNVAAEKKEEEKQDANLTAEEMDKTRDRRVAAEKKEEVNKNVTSENNAEKVIEMGVSEKDEQMEESVKESQEVLKGEAKDNVDKQEMDYREENVKEKQEGLEEEERVGSSKNEVAKDDGAAEKQDGNVAAEKKEEEKQDANLTAEEKDKTQDRKVAAEKKEEVSKNVTSEDNAEKVIEMGVSEKDDQMEESVKESQEVLKGEGKDNVDKQEMDDREENVKEKQEGLEEEERVISSKNEVAKDEQDGAAEKQDGNVAAEKKEEEKQDAKLTAEEKDKTQDRKVAAEKKEEVNKNVTSEKNAEELIEMGVSEKDEHMETNGKTTGDKQGGKKDSQIGGISKQGGQKKGAKRSNADIDGAENGSASKKEKDDEAREEVDESDKNVEENNDEAPKRKKARIVREEDHKKDKKQSSFKSRDAKDFLNTPSPYSLDRPVRTRKTVERLVEVIEKEPSGGLFVEKGRGTPLKNIPGVAYRIARTNQADLKFLHQILFGRFGKAADFKTHILEFSGFVWHESDEKHRAKVKEKLDKCSKETLFDLCKLFVIPVSRVNSKKEDIIMKLLDFIAEPRANDDSTLSDDQVSNSRKRRREGGSADKNSEGTHKRSRKNLDDEHTSRKMQQKYSEFEFDEGAEEGHKVDEHMKSDREEAKDDSEEADDGQEDGHESRKVKASQKSMEGKGSTAKRKAITGSGPKRAHVATLSKCSSRVLSSSKSSKDKQSSAEVSNLRKIKPIVPKHTVNSQKEISERRSSGKGLVTSKGQSAEAEKALPSKDELQNTMVGILKKVDFNTATYSDIVKLLGEHYKMDLYSMKEDIKLMIYDELVKMAEADED